MKTPFLGSAYTARSTSLACQQLVNLYPELVDTKSGKDTGAFFGCPGLVRKASIGNGPIRGLHQFNGSLYVVSGVGVYQVDASWSATFLGTISGTSSTVAIIDNGVHLGIFDRGAGWLVKSGKVTEIDLGFSPAPVAVYQDGFGLVLQDDSNVIWQSNLLDLGAWDGLNFSSVDGSPDKIVGLADLHREVWVIKENNTEIWVNAGTTGFAFQRLEGVFLHVGCIAQQSVTVVGETIAWLGRNQEGDNVVLMSDGYKAKRISTHAIEYRIASYDTTADAIGYSYMQEGHLFYVLTFPTGDETWCYDTITQAWHQRAAFSDGLFHRHAANCSTASNGSIVVGDHASNAVYEYDLDTLTDDGAPRKWRRSWRAQQDSTPAPTKFSALFIDFMTGMGVPDGTAPLMVLRWSDDGGHTWSNEKWSSVGNTGATAYRAIFRRLGSTRRNSGLDRVFELSGSDPFAIALIGADLN